MSLRTLRSLLIFALFWVPALLEAPILQAQTVAQAAAAEAEQAAQAAKAAADEAERLGGDVRMARDRAIAQSDRADAAEKRARAEAKRTDATQSDKDAAERAKMFATAADDEADRARATYAAGTEILEIFPFLGFGVDTFSGSEVLNYLNPEDSGDSKTRETMGISFQYPLFGNDATDRGIWLYGQTLHGVRSTDISCDYNQPLFLNPKCPPQSMVPTANQTALYILRNASSLEAMVGARFEFWPLQGGNAALYFSKQVGFAAVEDDDDDVADVHHFAFGARVKQGRFRNSFIEFGKGGNDLFTQEPNDRRKVNARVVARLVNDESGSKVRDWLSRSFFFAHITADVDGSDGGDAVQTFIGVAFCPWSSGRCVDK